MLARCWLDAPFWRMIASIQLVAGGYRSWSRICAADGNQGLVVFAIELEEGK
jgi:hypothetical protein